jgi:hypothetical protein
MFGGNCIIPAVAKLSAATYRRPWVRAPPAKGTTMAGMDEIGDDRGHEDHGRVLVSEFLAHAAVRVPARDWGLGPEGDSAIRSILGRLSKQDQVALLKAAVEELPALRRSTEPNARRHGELLYSAVVALYKGRLPLGEDDLCHLLVVARHDCGHGADTRPPFDLARAYLRKHGYSPRIGAAIETFVANLPSTSAVKVNELRRSAALIAVLGPRKPTPSVETWIGTVQHRLGDLGDEERKLWERLILAMSVSERMVLPGTWRRAAQEVVGELGSDVVLRRLREWWPVRPAVSLKDGGAQLLKHLIWMLELVPRDEGEELVAALVEVRFKGRREPLAVLKPAVAFLQSSVEPVHQDARVALEARIVTAAR